MDTVAATTDLSSVLQAAAQAVGEAFDDGGVCLVTHDGVVRQAGGFHPDSRVREPLQAALNLVLHSPVRGCGTVLVGIEAPMVVQPLTEQWIHDNLQPPERDLVVRLAPTAMLAVPLQCKQQRLGVLVAFRAVSDRPYTDDDVAMMTDIAMRIGPAVSAADTIERLHESAERWRCIAENTGEGVWVFDAQGRTTFVNERLAEMLGVPRVELLCQPARIFLDEAGRVAAVRRLRDRARGIGERYDERILRPDGSWLDVHVTAMPVHDNAGRPAGSLALVTDITHQVRAADLERQLEQIRRLDSLGQLAGGIAHDFNNLLVVMGGFAQVLQDRLEPDSALRPFTDQIVTAAGKGAALTRQLLEFGRGGHGRGEILDVAGVIGDLEPLLRRTLGEHIELAMDVAPDVERVMIDRGQLEQVIINLSANARDAMPDGGQVVIEYSDGFGGGPGGADVRCARIAVSDNGAGMDAETQRRAFEPFFTTKERGKGTGMGLASVYGIARRAGGWVSLHSEPGAGTTVKVFLPVVPSGQLRVPEPQAPAADLASAHVLAVEDQPDVADLLQLLLESAGLTVTVVTEPARALAHFHHGEPVDLLITDVIMPQMTGPELVSVLHAERPDLPVLYMSGYTAGMLGERGRVAPGTDLIEKPFSRGTLLAAVARALDGRVATPPVT